MDTYGSVSAAAETLGFTPRAVSQQVKRLERQTGVPLLERVGRGVMLTRHGRHLVEEGSRLLADLEQIQSGLHRQVGAVAGRVRLTAFSTAMRGLIGPVVADLGAQHPDLRIRLVEMEPWDAVDQVAGGQADVGLAHRWGDVVLEIPDHLERRVVHRDEAEVIVRDSGPGLDPKLALLEDVGPKSDRGPSSSSSARLTPRMPGQGLGVGLGAVHRLMSSVIIRSSPGISTEIIAVKWK